MSGHGIHSVTEQWRVILDYPLAFGYGKLCYKKKERGIPPCKPTVGVSPAVGQGRQGHWRGWSWCIRFHIHSMIQQHGFVTEALPLIFLFDRGIAVSAIAACAAKCASSSRWEVWRRKGEAMRRSKNFMYGEKMERIRRKQEGKD